MLSAALTGASYSQTPDAQTLYLIKTMDGDLFGKCPIDVYNISGNQISLQNTFEIYHMATGPVGLGIDAVNKNVFFTFEESALMDVYDIAAFNLTDQIPLAGTSNLAGIDTMEGRRLAFVIERGEPEIYVVNMDTLETADSWTLPNGYCTYVDESDDDADDDDTSEETGIGAYDVDCVENLDGKDLLFIANADEKVCWFDIDTHEEVGGVTADMIITGIAVDTYSGSPIIYGAASDNGAPGGHDYLIQYFTDTHIDNSVDLGSDGRGVDVSNDGSTVFVAVGGGFLLDPTLRAYDTSSLQEVDREILSCGTFSCSPTDLKVARLSLGVEVEKTITSHAGDIDYSDEVDFEITITNTSFAALVKAPVFDEYDTSQLTYISSTPPSDNNANDGWIEWSDLTASFGRVLEPGESFTIEARFIAEPEPCSESVDGRNVAHVRDAQMNSYGTTPDSSGEIDYTVICGCFENDDCDDGVFCNGQEQCDNGECVAGEDPCADDGLYCNGDEFCDESGDECGHTGDPCDEDRVCNEDTDDCDESVDDDLNDDADDDVNDDAGDDDTTGDDDSANDDDMASDDDSADGNDDTGAEIRSGDDDDDGGGCGCS